MVRRPLARLGSAHLLATIAIFIALAAPAGAALVNAKGIANNSIFSRHIRNGQVRSLDIGPRQVINRNLGVGAVRGNNLAAGSVGATQVADGSLTAADLAPGTIPTFSIGAGSITASQLATGAVGGAAIADGSVGTADLGTGVVTAAKIATGAVGEAEIGAGAVDSIELANGAVLAQHMGANAVGGGSLGAVVGASVAATDVVVAQNALDSGLRDDEEADATPVAFATEAFDSGAVWTIGSPTDLVVPSTGVYAADAWVSWLSEGATNVREAQVVVDGVIVAIDRRPGGSGSIGGRSSQTIAATFAASAGDVVQLRLTHYNTVASLTADRARLTVRRVGALPS